MRQLLTFCFLVGSIATLGQSINQEERVIQGLVWDNVAVIGTNVIQYKTMNGTVTQVDGIFALTVPKADTVLIHIPFCFDSFYVIYLPTEDYQKIVLNRKLKRQSQRTRAFWERRKKHS